MSESIHKRKIAIVGNLAGTGTEIIIELRRRGHKADLFISPNDYEYTSRDFSNSSLNPDWVHCFDPIFKERKKFNRFLERIHALFTQRIATIGKLFTYDVIHIHTAAINFSLLSYLLFVHFRLKPYLAFATGSDIRETAIYGNGIWKKLTKDFFKRGNRCFLLNADMVKLKTILDLPTAKFFPFAVNVQKYSPASGIKLKPQHKPQLKCYMMSNLDFGIEDNAPNRSSMKHNHRVIEALSSVISVDKNVHLYLTDRGPDRLQAKELVNKLGLSKYVTFLPPVNETERIKLIRSADIVLDQFHVGAFGLGAVQVLACGKPLITYFDQDFVDESYAVDPPILNAQNSEEIAAHILNARKLDYRNSIGQQARKWAVKFHSATAVVDKLEEEYQAVINEL